MPDLVVENLLFAFPDDWQVGKYDDWQFYRKHVIPMKVGLKAVDVLACSPGGIAYLIEVKDYRRHPHTKPTEIGDEFTDKVLCTLAGKVLTAKSLRLVLHLEQPKKSSRLFPRSIDPASVQQKVRQRLKAVDPRAIVTDMHRMGNLGFRVSSRVF